MSDMPEKEILSQDNDQPVTTQAEPPVQPQTPPQESVPHTVAPDGSYRYVPPRTATPQPPVQPYTPPQGGYYPPNYPSNYAPPAPPAPPKRSGSGWIVAVAVLAALSLVVFGIWLSFRWLDNTTDDENAAQSQNGSADTTPGREDAPSVTITPSGSPEDIDPDADYYYGDGGLSTESIVHKNYNSTVVLTMYMESTYHGFGENALMEAGAASGIVWTADGYIITNCHCVYNESAGRVYDRIDVTLYNGTVYEDAEVIGYDEATDLAVIRVDATDLVPAEFGDSDDLSVGSRVVALGNAAGLSFTATQGIVSAKARDVYDDTGYAIQCLQVDVAINSGNSGGPLLNKFGQVVAINSAKIAASGYEGLGFSIPINEAKMVLDSLAKYGYVKGRVQLGISGQTYDDGYYCGFLITEINKDSSLADTKAQPYDLIVAVDDVEVTDYGSLRAELAKHSVGDKVTLKLLRSDTRGNVTSFTVEVTLKEQTKP